MTATRIDAAFMVTCDGTCKLQHGWHLVIWLNGRWMCDGQCPVYFEQEHCQHIDEAIAAQSAGRRPTRLKVVQR